MGGGILFFIFTICDQVYLNKLTTTQQIIQAFIYKFIGAIVVGTVFGYLTSKWLRNIKSDQILAILITVVNCFIIIWFCYFTNYGTSSALSLSIYGQFMNSVGRAHFFQIGKYLMKILSIYDDIMWWLSQFILGVIAGCTLKDNFATFFEYVSLADVGKMVLFYVLAHLTCFVALCAIYPLTQFTGYGMNLKQMALISYSTYKGIGAFASIGIIFLDHSHSDNFRYICLLYCVGLTLLTQIINGYFQDKFVKLLNIQGYLKCLHPAKQRLQKNVLQELLLTTLEKQYQLLQDKNYLYTDWSTVNEILGIELQQAKIDKIEQKIQRRFSAVADASAGDCVSEMRYRALIFMKGSLWEKYEQHEIIYHTYRLILNSLNNSIDMFTKPLCVWEDVLLNFSSIGAMNLCLRIKDWYLVGGFARKAITDHLQHSYGIMITFRVVLEESKKFIKEFPMNERLIKLLEQEINAEIVLVEQYLGKITHKFSAVFRVIQTKRAVLQLVLAQRKYLQEKRHQLDESIFERLLKYVDQVLDNLRVTRFALELPNFDQFELEFPIFNCLTPEQQARLKREMADRAFSKGQAVLQAGEPNTEFFLIVSGNVEITTATEVKRYKGIGEILSFSNIVSNKGVSQTTARALTQVQVKALKIDVIQQIMLENSELQKRMYQNSIFGFVKAYPERALVLSEIEETRLMQLIQHGKLHHLQKFREISITLGAYLFQGMIKSKQAANAESPLILPPKLSKQSPRLFIRQSTKFSFKPSILRLSVLNDYQEYSYLPPALYETLSDCYIYSFSNKEIQTVINEQQFFEAEKAPNPIIPQQFSRISHINLCNNMEYYSQRISMLRIHQSVLQKVSPALFNRLSKVNWEDVQRQAEDSPVARDTKLPLPYNEQEELTNYIRLIRGNSKQM